MIRKPKHALETALGVRFRDSSLLRLALTHGSFVHERPDEAPESNERLEFLGDAFLSMVIAEELYLKFPDLPEGGLTEIRSSLVRTETLARIGAQLRLGDYLYLGRGEKQSGGSTRERNLAGALEAVLGALMLDQGVAKARKVTLALFGDLLVSQPVDATANFKSTLQEEVQSRGRPAPAYQTVAQEGTGPDRSFTVEVLVAGEVLAIGTGNTKRKAEQEAARTAYVGLSRPANKA